VSTALGSLLPRRAVRNARTASSALAAAIAQRLALTGDLDVDADEPGHLRRMTRGESDELLRAGAVGRYAYVARAGVPDVAPVNYVVEGDDVLVRSGPGPKLQSAERGDTVAFEVDDVDLATHTGRSVVVVGTASRCSPAELAQLDAVVDGRPWAAGPRHAVIRIRPSRVTGRRLT
jgi:nitroimidazol reductase NimA-like FMN-containing flavoprotein (pyridoxamine 5'-phosphate oxidase superfamily)